MRNGFAAGLYAEAVAMRIPQAHALTLGYAKQFRLKLLPFTLPNPRGYYYLFGNRLRMCDAEAHPESLDFRVAAHKAGKTISQLLESTLWPVTEKLRTEGEAAWPELEAKHDRYSTRGFLQFRRRFWEEDEGIFGGRSVTDLPIRAMYYPDHRRETGRGVVLASHTWGEDAQRWAALTPSQRIQLALRDVSRIHPQATEGFESGVSKVWQSDEFASGAFADIAPGQHTRLYDHIIAPEGRIHFAGEHASCLHAWIQGAIQSALRAACEVHARTLEWGGKRRVCVQGRPCSSGRSRLGPGSA